MTFCFFWLAHLAGLSRKRFSRRGNRITKQRNLHLQCSRIEAPKQRRTVSLKRQGPETAEKSTHGASSKSLNLNEIMASLTRLEVEMAERKPQRGSSMSKILKKRWAALKHLERGGADLRGRIRSEAENQKKRLKALEEEEEDIARKRAMNEEEKEEIRGLEEWLNNPLLTAAVLGDRIED